MYAGENGGVAHAELKLGAEFVLLGSTNEGDDRFNQGAGRTSVYVAVDDPDAHFARPGGQPLELRDLPAGLTAALKEAVSVDRPVLGLLFKP